MAAAIELALSEEDVTRLGVVARSRTEPASRVERARILLAYWENRENQSFFAVAQAIGVHHQTVQRCVERALAYGPMAALDDRPRPGKQPTITAAAKAWIVSSFLARRSRTRDEDYSSPPAKIPACVIRALGSYRGDRMRTARPQV